MKLKIAKSRPIDDLLDLFTHLKNFQQSGRMSFYADRRKFLKLAGMAGIGASVAGLSNLLLPEKAYGGCYTDYYGNVWCDPYSIWYYQYYERQLQAQYGALLLARLNQLRLEASYLQVDQPTSGRINLLNEKYEPASGYLSLTVVNSRSLDQLEDQRTAFYEVPSRSHTEVYFDDGPSGQYPGTKKVTAWTARSNPSSDLTVFA